MKRRIAGTIMLCCTILLLTGCGAASTIEGKPFDAEGAEYYSNLLDADFYGYAFQFQEDVQGQLMTQEILAEWDLHRQACVVVWRHRPKNREEVLSGSGSHAG